jgi:hypothetical protein
MKNNARRLPRFFGLMVAGLILFAAALPSEAASYPAKPIEMIIGAGPGSASDIIGRSLANSVRKFIDQPIVVINKTGGGGVVGTEYVIASKPDGYTILFGFGSGEHIMAPHMQKLPHNPVASLKTVILVTETPIVLAVKGDSPYKKVKDLIDFAKQNPGKASFGATPGGVTQIVPEVLAMKGGAKFVLIPTTGSGAPTSPPSRRKTLTSSWPPSRGSPSPRTPPRRSFKPCTTDSKSASATPSSSRSWKRPASRSPTATPRITAATCRTCTSSAGKSSNPSV